MSHTEEAFHKRNDNQSSLHIETKLFEPLSDAKLQILKEICADIDPFRPLSEELTLKLQEIGVQELEDPFKLTNHLLRTLEENINYRRQNEQASRATPSKH